MSKLTVIVTEDDPNASSFLKSILDNFSKELFIVSRLAELLQLCKSRNDIDLILYDLVLEDANLDQTIDTIPEVRNLQPKAALIVISGVKDNYIKQEVIDKGADAYAEKGTYEFSRDALLIIIHKVMTRRRHESVDMLKQFVDHILQSCKCEQLEMLFTSP